MGGRGDIAVSVIHVDDRIARVGQAGDFNPGRQQVIGFVIGLDFVGQEGRLVGRSKLDIITIGTDIVFDFLKLTAGQLDHDRKFDQG